MSALCPCCGAALPSNVPWVWDLASGTLTTQAGSTRFTRPSEIKLLDALIVARKHFISKDDAIFALYEYRDEPEHTDNILHVVTCRMRKSLAAIGVEIVAEHGRGYRIVLPRSERAA